MIQQTKPLRSGLKTIRFLFLLLMFAGVLSFLTEHWVCSKRAHNQEVRHHRPQDAPGGVTCVEGHQWLTARPGSSPWQVRARESVGEDDQPASVPRDERPSAGGLRVPPGEVSNRQYASTACIRSELYSYTTAARPTLKSSVVDSLAYCYIFLHVPCCVPPSFIRWYVVA